MAEKRKYSKKYCKFTEAKIDFIDYKDTALLKQCLSERFKIMPRRLTGTSKKHQEMVEKAKKQLDSSANYVMVMDELLLKILEVRYLCRQ